MENFRGFTEQTNDFLVGIKFNNNKEWFNANKLMYTENVHKPIVALANEVYEKMHEYKKNFNEKPKISRINRDIRFSNNKSPYKISKWFFLRGDGSPHIRYEKPTYFFEMSGVINKAANTSKAKNKRTEALKDVQIESQIKGLIKVFETDGKIDVICHSEDKTFIIPSKKEFFTDGKGDVIRTGNFRMLGKIVKICSEKENISLLRDTKIGKIKNSILDTAIESFNDPEIKNVVDFETVVTNYDNAILVYPIAIYI